jgi:hypothetical protein
VTIAMEEARRAVATDFDGARFVLLVADDAQGVVDLLVAGGLFVAPPRAVIAVVGAQAEALAAHAEYRRYARANQARARFYPGATSELTAALAAGAAALLFTTAPRAAPAAPVTAAIEAGKPVLAPAEVLVALGVGASGIAADTRAAYRAAAGRLINGR